MQSVSRRCRPPAIDPDDIYRWTCTMEHVPSRAVAWCQSKPAFHLGNLFRLPQPPRLINMALRCLLFSSDEAAAQSLGRVITELGMEGEHCRKALEAVERLTIHPFHIVIAD